MPPVEDATIIPLPRPLQVTLVFERMEAVKPELKLAFPIELYAKPHDPFTKTTRY